MKFAHLGDCHLGGWRHPELTKLNIESFRYAIDKCIKEKMDFVLIAGDLFDIAYPSIDTIKEAFNEFRKLKEANIPVFYIAGSHDYSVAGKSFLDVLEKSGFAKNVHQPEEKGDSIILQPVIYQNVALYGYPGKKSGLEVAEIERMKIQDAPGLFKILLLHTAIRDAIGSLPIPAVNEQNLPKVNYTAMAHLHIEYNKENRVYCGPTFPNNSGELEDLKGGSYYVYDNGKIEKRLIRLKEVVVLDLEIKDALTAVEKIMIELKAHDLKDKIVILKLKGILERGKITDIDFTRIDNFAKDAGMYVLLKNTTKLRGEEAEIKVEMKSENVEEEILKDYQIDNKNKFNHLIGPLLSSMQIERKEDEAIRVFEERLLDEVKKIIKIS